MNNSTIDLSQAEPAQLEALAENLFEELAKRELRVNVLNRLSNRGLWNMGFSILSIFRDRHDAANDDDKQKYDKIYQQVIRTLFPDILEAARFQVQFVRILEAMKPIVPLLRKGQAPKKERNELIHKYRCEVAIEDWNELYRIMIEQHPDLMRKGKDEKAKHIKPISMQKEYEKWLKNTPPDNSSV